MKTFNKHLWPSANSKIIHVDGHNVEVFAGDEIELKNECSKAKNCQFFDDENISNYSINYSSNYSTSLSVTTS